MRTLIIETSTSDASIAVAEDHELIGQVSFTSDRRHNSVLFAHLSKLLEEVQGRDFQRILVGSGPGSYSGTRVGIAAAQGIALVTKAEPIAIPSVLGTRSALASETSIALGDARRGSYWFSKIEAGTVVSIPSLIDRLTFEEMIAGASKDQTPVFCLEAISGYSVSQETSTAENLFAAWRNSSDEVRTLMTEAIPSPLYLAPPHITPSKNGSVIAK